MSRSSTPAGIEGREVSSLMVVGTRDDADEEPRLRLPHPDRATVWRRAVGPAAAGIAKRSIGVVVQIHRPTRNLAGRQEP
jgi:hypothetical protein